MPQTNSQIKQLEKFNDHLRIKITFCFQRSPITWELYLTTINPSSESICNSSTPFTIDVFPFLFCLGANKRRCCLLTAHRSLTCVVDLPCGRRRSSRQSPLSAHRSSRRRGQQESGLARGGNSFLKNSTAK
jgi:hypothetical protein